MSLKKMFSTLAVALVVIIGGSLTVVAAPDTMPDGNLFDAEYYATNNPDVVATLGTDTAVLYTHYMTSGILEGRLPYDPAYNSTNSVQQAPQSVPENSLVIASYSGTGSKVLTPVSLPEGIYRVVMKHNGSSNFIVVPYNASGKRISSLVNEIGVYNGTAIIRDNINGGMIEVKADGTWTISIEIIPTGGTSNMSGNGDAVSPWFNLKSGALVASTSYVGNSNFIVVVYDENGNRYSSLANEIGTYSGQAVFNRGNLSTKYCISVRASGPWSVNFGLNVPVTNVQ